MIGIILFTSLVGCSRHEGKHMVVVGTIAGPETQLMQTAKQVAKQKYDLDVKIVTFSDYNTPNAALASGDLDANAFQDLPFLQAQVKARGYKIVAVGNTFLYPMGLYSKKIKSLDALNKGAKIAIPNDPSNEARALTLLQKAGLIKLKPNAGVNATPQAIVSNPKQLQFVELDAAQLPRALNDVAVAAINTNYAIPAGLSPAKDALFHESKDSIYMNIIAAQAKDKAEPKITDLVKAYQSPEVAAKAKQLFGSAAIKGW